MENEKPGKVYSCYFGRNILIYLKNYQ